MMPPTNPLPAPTGDVAPGPGSALDLGGGRWLLTTGVVATTLSGQRVRGLTSNTLAYWENAAQRAGSTLDDLIV